MNRKITFTVNGHRCLVEARTKHTDREWLSIDGETVEPGAIKLSLSGTAAGGAGQISDTLRDLGRGSAEVGRLCDLWDRWHLNDLRPGSRKQVEYLKANNLLTVHYAEKVAALEAAGLNETYKYGSKWLFEIIPDEALTELEDLLDRINGSDLGASPHPDDLPEVDQYADTIDSRDVIARYDGLRLALEAAGYDLEALPEEGDELVEEFKEIAELWAEGEESSEDWQGGTTLVNDAYFTEYAQELADDTGSVNPDADWPNCHIDWESAAEALKQDYTAIEFRGVTFWVR